MRSPRPADDQRARSHPDRRVSIRPAPDCMTYLTAFLPMVEGVTAYGVLHRAAMTANCDPHDHRTKGQVVADTVLNGRLRKLGQPAQADRHPGRGRAGASGPGTAPGDDRPGDLVSTDARRRDFPEVARMFLTARDQLCRTPFCGSAIRHAAMPWPSAGPARPICATATAGAPGAIWSRIWTGGRPESWAASSP